ncbi:transcriptional activator xlnR [Fusarium solani]|uniref:Transcriptional activator xlnR n=1 Tax=Fusarium solani TaxID=169388 RepID=A0A9P9G2Y7_FUSSL|nr:transcriptional activator xlnR [Fusarium solani]KAH7231531.1 transcriptional activator xlnR [Fusarium solani]
MDQHSSRAWADTAELETNQPADTRLRRRTRMACDKCHSSRTRCDGLHPCQDLGKGWIALTCLIAVEYGYPCQYNRRIKKRGRVRRYGTADSVIAAQMSTFTRPGYQNDKQSTPSSPNPASAQLLDSGQHQQEGDIGVLPSSRRLGESQPAQHPQQQDPAACGPSSRDGRSIVSSAIHPSNRDGPSPVESNGSQQTPTSSTGSASTTGALPCLSIFSPSEFAVEASVDRNLTPQRASAVFECRYPCLYPLLPFFSHSFPASLACDLFDVYLLDHRTSLSRSASPCIITRIFRKKSLLHPTNPRQTSPALLATILWCCAQTADLATLLVPGSRSMLTDFLYELAVSLISCRDPDGWRRTHGGWRVESEQVHHYGPSTMAVPNATGSSEQASSIDDVHTFLLLCIGVSAGDFKSDCQKWWSKATRLAMSLQLNVEVMENGNDSLDPTRKYQSSPWSMGLQAREERRRVFWYLYSIDRHLALSSNQTLQISDSMCENLDDIPYDMLPSRSMGPPTTISGAGYFQYFLPLMAILGDIIVLRHARHHPRLAKLNNALAPLAIADTIAECEESVKRLAQEVGGRDTTLGTLRDTDNLSAGQQSTQTQEDRRYSSGTPAADAAAQLSELRLALAYSTHILHVLPALSEILRLDPELRFMPCLFGVYLLHGSLILLLFADRMPQLGRNQSVEQACENIIRAHEVCVLTLNTEFQRNLRRVFRLTLYSVQGANASGWEEFKQTRRQILSLYRWTKGARGLRI